jgi:SAM-dependent methyltransferase
VTDARRRWNHNIEYHPVIFRAVGTGRLRALDVGCGEGMLARRLRHGVGSVVGIDSDPASIELARRQDPDGRIDFVLGDFLQYPFEPGSFDAVVSVATLHHVDPAAGLARMVALLAPGGALCVVGLARTELPRDLGWEAAAVLGHRAHLLTKQHWQHPSPVVMSMPHTHRELRAVAARVLPGVRYRRHVLWRYSLTWVKPDLGR